MPEPEQGELTQRVWQAITGRAETIDELRITGPANVLPSVFDVTGLASATIAAATAATARLLATRSGQPLRSANVDRRAASAAHQLQLSPGCGRIRPGCRKRSRRGGHRGATVVGHRPGDGRHRVRRMRGSHA